MNSSAVSWVTAIEMMRFGSVAMREPVTVISSSVPSGPSWAFAPTPAAVDAIATLYNARCTAVESGVLLDIIDSPFSCADGPGTARNDPHVAVLRQLPGCVGAKVMPLHFDVQMFLVLLLLNYNKVDGWKRTAAAARAASRGRSQGAKCRQ